MAAWRKRRPPSPGRGRPRHSSAPPPITARRPAEGEELVWDLARHRGVAAYNDFMSSTTVDALVRLCRRAKAVLGGRKLVGTYYGYAMTLCGNGRAQMRSSYSLKRLLGAGAVDFLMSPQPYGVRALGCSSGDMKPFATMAANGIVPVVEADPRTHNAAWLERSNHGQTLTAEQTAGIARRAGLEVALAP